jgi:hypothetical protein
VRLFLVILAAFSSSGIAWADRGRGGGHRGDGGDHFRGDGDFHGHRGFHHRGHFGIFIGPAFPPGYYYPWPYYAYPYAYPYYPPLAAAPPQYTERGDTALQPFYWYYCANPAGYYPTVRACPGGWQQIAPVPAANP